MRIRGALFVALAGCVSANFFACGTSSFSSESAVDGGGTDASSGPDTSTSSDGAPSGFDDGSAGGDANAEIDATARDSGTDAAAHCTVTISAIQNQTDAGVACPTVGNCPGPTNTTCCIDDLAASGSCQGGCSVGFDSWSCEKTSDCGGGTTKCCLTASAGSLDLTTCPARVPAASSCVIGGCGIDQRLCTKNSDCADIAAGTNCRPVYATFGGVADAGTMVGVCVAL